MSATMNPDPMSSPPITLRPGVLPGWDAVTFAVSPVCPTAAQLVAGMARVVPLKFDPASGHWVLKDKGRLVAVDAVTVVHDGLVDLPLRREHKSAAEHHRRGTVRRALVAASKMPTMWAAPDYSNLSTLDDILARFESCGIYALPCHVLVLRLPDAQASRRVERPLHPGPPC